MEYKIVGTWLEIEKVDFLAFNALWAFAEF